MERIWYGKIMIKRHTQTEKIIQIFSKFDANRLCRLSLFNSIYIGMKFILIAIDTAVKKTSGTLHVKRYASLTELIPNLWINNISRTKPIIFEMSAPPNKRPTA